MSNPTSASEEAGEKMSRSLSTSTTPALAVSAAAANYVLALRRLGGTTSAISTGRIAAELNVRPPSAVSALQRLGKDGLVRIFPQEGAMLTPAGADLARELFRRHALAEVLLHKVLKLEWDELHVEATRIQAAVSPRLEAALAERFADVTQTPYGQPIPTAEGNQRDQDLVRLDQLGVGCGMTICEVEDSHAERLRQYRQVGLMPGVSVHVLSRDHADVLRVRVGDSESEVSSQSASGVLGVPTTPEIE